MRIPVFFFALGIMEHLGREIERGLHGRDGTSWKILSVSRIYDMGEAGTLMWEVTSLRASHYLTKPSRFDPLQEWNPFSSIDSRCA